MLIPPLAATAIYQHSSIGVKIIIETQSLYHWKCH